MLRNKIRCLHLTACSSLDAVSYPVEQDISDVIYILRQFKSASNLEAIKICDSYNAILIAIET